MTDVDLDLKRLFDERLGGMSAGPRPKRRARGGARVVAGAAAGAIVLVGAGFALDVNQVAASSGADCAGFLTKVQIWAQSHRTGLGVTDHEAARAELAKMVAQSGCSPHPSNHDGTHSGQNHH